MEKKQVRRVYRLSDILISGGILVLGLLFTFVTPSLRWLGITLLLTALFMLPFYRTGYSIESQKGAFLKKDIMLPRECKGQIADYMEGKASELNINPFRQGGLLMEWYFKKDRSQQFGQLYDYENNRYTPQSKLSELTQEQVDTILKHQS